MKYLKEKIFKYLTITASILTITILFAIILSLFINGMPIFGELDWKEFFLTTQWHPNCIPSKYGILALIVASLLVTLGALVIAVPFGLGTAIYVSEVAKPGLKEIIKPIIELLAGIPSVIYGLFGLVFLAPFLMKVFNIPVGLNLATASIILGIMVIPIIASISEDAITNVPKSLKEASYGLGATKWETTMRVVVPAAKKGILGSIILGFGRAIGETMVVVMVAGGAAQLPKSLFSPVRPMTATIAAEMGETVIGSKHFHALFCIAIVLFIFTFISNLIAELIIHRKKY